MNNSSGSQQERPRQSSSPAEAAAAELLRRRRFAHLSDDELIALAFRQRRRLIELGWSEAQIVEFERRARQEGGVDCRDGGK